MLRTANVAQDVVDDSGALERMATNSTKMVVTRRMYLTGLLRKAVGKAETTSCNKTEIRMVVDVGAVEAPRLRNFWVLP